ncbi:MAG: S-ribosylhomocysteine lyase [Clostridia bacterium]|nr:S-ribosylhomocysteine lyase [Clostridia bacterium]
MKKIASFQIDHRILPPGMYVSRVDGDVTTFDLRVKRPNAGDYMSHLEMHSVEHMFATYIRNSEIADRVIYFGPMGCRTGFYLLTRDLPPEKVKATTLSVLEQILAHEGGMFGQSEEECGNYRELSVEAAKNLCREYLAVLKNSPDTFAYPVGGAK